MIVFVRISHLVIEKISCPLFLPRILGKLVTSVTKGGRDHSVTSFGCYSYYTISRRRFVPRDLPELAIQIHIMYIEAGQSAAPSGYVSGRVTF